jgi:tryptophan 2,3-dioxygenase
MNKINYSDYLQLDKILSAQKPISQVKGDEKHEEMLFIIVHQAHELWFKQILYELDSINALFSHDIINDTKMLTLVKRLQRINVIQRLLLEQLETLNTMTPMDFLEFRDLIIPASGFQSVQFRQLEIKLGVKRKKPQLHCLIKEQIDVLEKAGRENSLFFLVEKWLERTPFINNDEFVFWKEYKRAVLQAIEHDRQLVLTHKLGAKEEQAQRLAELKATEKRFQAFFDEKSYQQLIDNNERRMSFKASSAALFIFLYRMHPILQLPYQILSSLIQIDENLSTWRSKHILMVQRMIGTKIGTGGSSGVAYLQEGLKQQVFYDLTSLSTFMVSSSALPKLPATTKHLLGFSYHHDEE